MSVRKVALLSDGFFEIDKGFLVYAKAIYYGKIYKAALKPLLVETEDERIIIDTGIGELPERIRKYVNLDRKMTIEKSLKKHGLDPEDISMVINTHLHLDHCGNNFLFKSAKFIVQKKELEYARNPHRFQKNAYVEEAWNSASYDAVEGETQIGKRIKLIPTPGHTPGHQSVIIEGARRYIYCGDIAPLRENLEQRNIVGVLHNPVEALESIDLLRSLNGYPIFSHDNEQMSLE